MKGVLFSPHERTKYDKAKLFQMAARAQLIVSNLLR